jgi:hypothetical protein
VESTLSFEGMPTGYKVTLKLSKLICSSAHKDNFMKTPSNFVKIMEL